MIKTIELTFHLEPVPKARSRVTAMKNGGMRSYTPERTQVAQLAFKQALVPYLQYRYPPHIALKLTCIFYRTRTKWGLKREQKPFRRADIDNYTKLAMDSLSKGHSHKNTDDRYLIEDDAQITTLYTAKRWSDGQGYIKIRLEEDNDI
ncbi:MAG: RusA family crossover junction endodeoxyribonuclease [Bacteroidetes bacterium]|nr:RusA family crossover junction endodeoxyribonuclease [Bacteroidota bacterium]